MSDSTSSPATQTPSIKDELLARLGTLVEIWTIDAATRPAVVDAAAQSEDGSAILADSSGRAEVGLRLNDNEVAAWTTKKALGYSSIKHARTVIDLHNANDQVEQLRSEHHQTSAEIEALATQVVNDFEELSLIRSLASAMELPLSGINLSEICSRSLVPLTEGIGAVSIAAIFLEDNETTFCQPWWSCDKLVDDNVMINLIKEHREEAQIQPVVRNKENEFEHVIEDSRLNEFIIVQCRSEGRLHGWIIACNRADEDGQDVPWAQLGFTTTQAVLLETATNQLAAQLHNGRLLRQKEELFTDVVRALVNAVEARDPYTCGHSERVAQFARCLAGLIGESHSSKERIYLTGLLHDVGKIAIPDGVLQKPGHLDDQERAIIETHTDAGWRILHELEALQDVLPGVLYHHEHFDGNGYPDGLVGENIPLDGRILAVCDAFDAMTSNRPYRDGMPIEKAVGILREGAGTYWDPALIDAFCDNIGSIDEIRMNHRPRQQVTRPAPVDGVPVYTIPDAHAAEAAAVS